MLRCRVDRSIHYWRTGSDFDFGVSFTDEYIEAGSAEYNYRTATRGGESPGLGVFIRHEGQVYHTYSCYARGRDMLNSAYHHMDLVPRGRDEDGLPYPMAWVRREDEYGS